MWPPFLLAGNKGKKQAVTPLTHSQVAEGSSGAKFRSPLLHPSATQISKAGIKLEIRKAIIYEQFWQPLRPPRG